MVPCPIPSIWVSPASKLLLGDHICGLYSTQVQRDQIMLPFLEAGLAAGDKCICVVDGTDPTGGGRGPRHSRGRR